MFGWHIEATGLCRTPITVSSSPADALLHDGGTVLAHA